MAERNALSALRLLSNGPRAASGDARTAGGGASPGHSVGGHRRLLNRHPPGRHNTRTNDRFPRKGGASATNREDIAQYAGEINSSLMGDSVQAWDKPISFSTVQTPAFPTSHLPGPVAAFVEQLAESTQTPEEMAGVLSLGVLSTAFQSRDTVEITPDWKEPLCLYTVAVAPPGERKSAVIAALAAPVYEYEAEQREREAAEIAQNQTERALLEKALAAAQSSAVKSKGNFAEPNPV